MAVRQLLYVFLSAVLVWRRVGGIKREEKCRHLSFQLADSTRISVARKVNEEYHVNWERGSSPQSPVEIDPSELVSSDISIITAENKEQKLSLSLTDLQKYYLQKKVTDVKKNDVQKELIEIQKKLAGLLKKLTVLKKNDLQTKLIDLHTKLTDLQNSDLQEELIVDLRDKLIEIISNGILFEELNDLQKKLTDLQKNHRRKNDLQKRQTDLQENDLGEELKDLEKKDLQEELADLQKKLNDLQEELSLLQTTLTHLKTKLIDLLAKPSDVELRDVQMMLVAQKLIAHWDWVWNGLLPQYDRDIHMSCSFVSEPGFRFATALASSLYPDVEPQEYPDPLHYDSVLGAQEFPKPAVHYDGFFEKRESLESNMTPFLPNASGVLCIMIDWREDQSVGMLSVYSRSKEAFEKGEDPIFIHLDAIVNGEKVSAMIPIQKWKTVISTWRLEENSSLVEVDNSLKPDLLDKYGNILNEFGWTRCEKGGCYEATTEIPKPFLWEWFYFMGPRKLYRMMPRPNPQVFKSKLSEKLPTVELLSALAIPLKEREASPANSAISQTRAMKRTKHKRNRKARKNRKRIRRNKK